MRMGKRDGAGAALRRRKAAPIAPRACYMQIPASLLVGLQDLRICETEAFHVYSDAEGKWDGAGAALRRRKPFPMVPRACFMKIPSSLRRYLAAVPLRRYQAAKIFLAPGGGAGYQPGFLSGCLKSECCRSDFEGGFARGDFRADRRLFRMG